MVQANLLTGCPNVLQKFALANNPIMDMNGVIKRIN